MAQEADSYGTPEGVAAYVGIYTIAGSFTTATTPTLATVTRWIDQVSDVVNVALATSGFRTPITQADAKAALDMFVEQLVADLAHAANSKGRLLNQNGTTNYQQIGEDVLDWVSARAIGFINLGIDRATGTLGSIGSKGWDDAGEEVTYIFQRKGFGNTFDEWTQK